MRKKQTNLLKTILFSLLLVMLTTLPNISSLAAVMTPSEVEAKSKNYEPEAYSTNKYVFSVYPKYSGGNIYVTPNVSIRYLSSKKNQHLHAGIKVESSTGTTLYSMDRTIGTWWSMRKASKETGFDPSTCYACPDSPINIGGAAPSKPTINRKVTGSGASTAYSLDFSSSAASTKKLYLSLNWYAGSAPDNMFDTGWAHGVEDPIVAYKYVVDTTSTRTNSYVNTNGTKTTSDTLGITSTLRESAKTGTTYYAHVIAISYTGEVSPVSTVNLRTLFAEYFHTVTITNSPSGAFNDHTGARTYLYGEAVGLTIGSTTGTYKYQKTTCTTDSTYSFTATSKSFTMPNKNLSFTAYAKKQVTLTVTPGTGIKSFTVNGTSYTSAVTVTLYEGDSFNATATTQTYYSGTDWTANVSGYGKTDSSYIEFTMPSSNLTYTVAAEKVKYTITYAGLNSTTTPTSISSSTKTAESTCTVTSTVPTKNGYQFNGWKCTAGPSSMLSKTYNNGDSFSLTSNVTFTAQWSANTTSPDGHNKTGILQQTGKSCTLPNKVP